MKVCLEINDIGRKMIEGCGEKYGSTPEQVIAFFINAALIGAASTSKKDLVSSVTIDGGIPMNIAAHGLGGIGQFPTVQSKIE